MNKEKLLLNKWVLGFLLALSQWVVYFFSNSSGFLWYLGIFIIGVIFGIFVYKIAKISEKKTVGIIALISLIPIGVWHFYWLFDSFYKHNEITSDAVAEYLILTLLNVLIFVILVGVNYFLMWLGGKISSKFLK